MILPFLIKKNQSHESSSDFFKKKVKSYDIRNKFVTTMGEKSYLPLKKTYVFGFTMINMSKGKKFFLLVEYRFLFLL